MITVVLNFPSHEILAKFFKAVATSPALTTVYFQAAGMTREALEAIEEGAAVAEAEQILAGEKREGAP